MTTPETVWEKTAAGGQTRPTHPDLSYGPFGQVLAQSANQGLGFDSKVHGHDGKRIAGQTDQSYKSATDFAAENITNNLGNKSAVSGYGRAPVGHPDSSYDPAIGDVSKNFGLDSAVTGRGRQVIGAPNMSYWGNLEDEKLREIPLDFMQKGVQQGMKDMQILFYSGASLAGEHLFDIVGGDDTSLRRVQGIMDQHQKERQNMGRLNVDRIHVEGDPEKTHAEYDSIPVSGTRKPDGQTACILCGSPSEYLCAIVRRVFSRSVFTILRRFQGKNR